MKYVNILNPQFFGKIVDILFSFDVLNIYKLKIIKNLKKIESKILKYSIYFIINYFSF